MSQFRRRAHYTINTVAGDGIVVITKAGDVGRTIFDGPDAATYNWLVRDIPAPGDTLGKPVAGRAVQYGDQIIVEEYPVEVGFTVEIIDTDTDGAYEVYQWLK
jgi:hypothetical protein